MAATLYRFPAAEGLTHLLDRSSSTTTTDTTALQGCRVHSAHDSLNLNGANPTPSPLDTKSLHSFDHLVCDFDETITDHDTTSSFDTLAGQIRQEEHDQPELSWSEILQAYLDDLEKVDISDLCHLSTHNNNNSDGLLHPRPQLHLDPRVRDLKCHTDGRILTPEPELPTPKIASLQPWIHSQVRKRAVEKISLDRVYDSGNLVGMTKSQIRAYGRDHIRLRPGMVRFLKAFVAEQDRIEEEEQQNQHRRQNGPPAHIEVEDQPLEEKEKDINNTDPLHPRRQRRRRGELWILSVNWSKDLIKGAMDQIFGSEEATRRYLPDHNIISSNLQFSKECRDVLMKQRKAVSSKVLEKEDKAAAADEAKKNRLSIPLDSFNGGLSDAEQSEGEDRLSNGKVKVRCLTGTDKLHAFQKIQRDYAGKHDLALTETKWAYFGDSTTDLGCLGKFWGCTSIGGHDCSR